MRIHVSYRNTLYIGTYNEAHLRLDFVPVFIRDYGTIEIPTRVLLRHIDNNLVYYIPKTVKFGHTVRAKINKTSHHDFMNVVHTDLECSVTSFER
jgi:hypothetical protein